METPHIRTYGMQQKFIAINACIKKKEWYQISNLTLWLKELEKENTEFKVSRRKEIIKIRVEINEIENRKPKEKINQTKHWLFERWTKLANPYIRVGVYGLNRKKKKKRT